VAEKCNGLASCTVIAFPADNPAAAELFPSGGDPGNAFLCSFDPCSFVPKGGTVQYRWVQQYGTSTARCRAS
jgi:hypothetical protein